MGAFFVGVVRMSMHHIHAVLEQEGYVVIEAANSYEGLLAAAARLPAGAAPKTRYRVVFYEAPSLPKPRKRSPCDTDSGH